MSDYEQQAIDAGFTPWAGGDKAPDDWDGGEVLLRKHGIRDAGNRRNIQGCRWYHHWQNPHRLESPEYDIIGYRKKPEAPALPVTVEQGALEMAQRDHERMREAGCKLAEAALHVIREYDGIHRLSLAVAGWATAIAGEGDRGLTITKADAGEVK